MSGMGGKRTFPQELLNVLPPSYAQMCGIDYKSVRRRGSMGSIVRDRDARVAGLLYLIAATPGPFAYVFAPAKVRVRSDPVATVQHMVANAGTLRSGVLAELL